MVAMLGQTIAVQGVALLLGQVSIQDIEFGENCVACVGDLCVQVDSEGKVDFVSIPAVSDLQRVEVLCSDSVYEELFGRSLFFQVEPGEVISIPEFWEMVLFTDPLPSTESIELLASKKTITQAEEAVSLQVIAELSDGSSVDATNPPETAGTSYRSSNTGVIAVDTSGHVEVVGSTGNAFVTAFNEGRSATVRLTVSLDDLLTDVEGAVERETEDGSRVAVAGARVALVSAGLECAEGPCVVVTGTDGRFSISGVVTSLDRIDGTPDALTLAASYSDAGRLLLGAVSGLEPSTDGSPTDAGTIVLNDQPCPFDASCLSSGCRLSLDDDASVQVDFTGGFVFPFFGVDYDHVYINSNGSITFGSGDAETYDPEVPEGAIDGLPRISPLFVDLAPSEGGAVYYHQTADSFVVTWYEVPVYHQEDSRNTAQVVLHQDGRIYFRYRDLTTDGSALGADEELDISVGVSPGGTPTLLSKDYSLDGPFSSSGLLQAVLENFHGSAAEDAASTAASSNLFDLEEACVLWNPNSDDGFDVYFVKGPASGSGGSAALEVRERRKPGRPAKALHAKRDE